jgi:hypothetical protein
MLSPKHVAVDRIAVAGLASPAPTALPVEAKMKSAILTNSEANAIGENLPMEIIVAAEYFLKTCTDPVL